MLARFERAARLANHLAVFQHVCTLRDVCNADLVTKCDVVRQFDPPGCIALEGADFSATAAINQGRHIISRVQHDGARHLSIQFLHRNFCRCLFALKINQGFVKADIGSPI